MASILHFITIGLVSLADPIHWLVIIVAAVAAPRWPLAAMIAATLAVIIQTAIGWSPTFSQPPVVFVTLAAAALNIGIVKWRSVKAESDALEAEKVERQQDTDA